MCQRASKGKHVARCKARYVRSYLVTSGDLGHTVRVTVLASNAWGTSSATSTATAVIARASSSPSTPAPTPAPVSPSPPTPVTGTSGPFGLYLSGDHLINSEGQIVELHGVNRAGPVYMCIQGNGIFDGGGPANSSGLVLSQTAASVAALAAWHINIVRIPLNEDCWLGINAAGIANWSEDSGQNYIDAIVDYVDLLHRVRHLRRAVVGLGRPRRPAGDLSARRAR